MSGLLSQFTEFAKTPEGQGLLSAAFGGLATAQRGAPLNSIGRAGMAGLAGYANAQDRVQQQADNAFQQQYRTMQMDAMKQQQDKAKAEQAWRGKLPELMTPKLQGQTEQAQMLANQMGPDASPEDVQAMNAGARMPVTGLEYGMDKMALQRHLMDPSSPFADKALEQLFYPKADDYRVVGTDLVKIGPTGVSVAHQSQRPDNLPSEQKLYNLAKDQGYKGSFMDFMRDRVSNTEGAKAAYDLVTMTTPDGKTYMVPRSNLVGGGQTAPAPSAPSPRPGAPASTQPPGNYRGSGYNGGSSAAASSDQIAIIQGELDKARASGKSADVQSLERELSRLKPVGGVQVQSEAEKAAAIARAKSDAESQSGDAAKKAEARKEFAMNTANNVISTIDGALGLVGYTTTGPGSLLSGVSGTPARDLAAQLETIKANLGFDRLQQMRDMSPTGGALGSVAVQELTALQSTVSSLDQGQSPAQLKASLAKIKSHYENWRDAVIKDAGGGVSGSWGDKGSSPAPARPVPQSAINELKMRKGDPAAQRQFDAVFGEGAAARALGGK